MMGVSMLFAVLCLSGAMAIPNDCLPDFDRGPCTLDIERWHYDIKTENCRPFHYGGCLGNTNRFSTRNECETTCTPASKKIVVPTSNIEVCLQEPATGSCQQIALTRFYFDASVGQCRPLTYGGCEGANENNFSTIEECESRCRTVKSGLESGRLATATPPFSWPEVSGSVPGVRPERATNSRCLLPLESGPCRASFPAYGFDRNQQKCVKFIYGGCNGNSNRFASRQGCMQQCGG